MTNPSKKLHIGKGCVRSKELEDLALDLVGRTMHAMLHSGSVLLPTSDITIQRFNDHVRGSANVKCFRSDPAFPSCFSAVVYRFASSTSQLSYFRLKESFTL